MHLDLMNVKWLMNRLSYQINIEKGEMLYTRAQQAFETALNIYILYVTII